MNAKKQFLYSASLRARECWIDRELLSSHYKIKTEMLPTMTDSGARSTKNIFYCGTGRKACSTI